MFAYWIKSLVTSGPCCFHIFRPEYLRRVTTTLQQRSFGFGRNLGTNPRQKRSSEPGACLTGDGSVRILAPALWDLPEPRPAMTQQRASTERTGGKEGRKGSTFCDRCVIFGPDEVCFPQETTTFHRNLSKMPCGPSTPAAHSRHPRR